MRSGFLPDSDVATSCFKYQPVLNLSIKICFLYHHCGILWNIRMRCCTCIWSSVRCKVSPRWWVTFLVLSAHGYAHIRTVLGRLTFHWVIWNPIKSPLKSKEIFPLISEGFDQAHGEHVLEQSFSALATCAAKWIHLIFSAKIAWKSAQSSWLESRDQKGT